MAKPDETFLHWQDVPAAVGLLTRFPVHVDTEFAQARGAKAAWAYPIVGLKIGVLLAVIAWVLSGLPAQITALLLVGINVVVTGAMHEDGLADSADGLWGGWEKARRLEIMKDSRIGAYGVLALVISIGLRWACLSLLLASPMWVAALIVPAMLGRAAMVALMHALPNARDGGLSRSVGRPDIGIAAVAAGIAALAALVGFGGQGVALIFVAAITAGLCAWIAQRKIGGQTGDILGGTQQVVEIAALIALTAAL